MLRGMLQKKNGLVTREEDQTHYYVTEVITIKIMKGFCFMLCLRKHTRGKEKTKKKKMGEKRRHANMDIIMEGINLKNSAKLFEVKGGP